MKADCKDLQPIDILLVEDNPGDIELLREALEDAKTASRIHIARDGEEALEFLYRRGVYADAVRPDIILMDLNMPRKCGKEVLAIVKQDPALSDIPIIIFTSSEAEQDILESYRLHANAYIAKPANLPQLLQTVDALERFWMTLVKLPSQRRKKDEKSCSCSS